jgi:pimeloyl-ACP methyl ester carboxylesterase
MSLAIEGGLAAPAGAVPAESGGAQRILQDRAHNAHARQVATCFRAPPRPSAPWSAPKTHLAGWGRFLHLAALMSMRNAFVGCLLAALAAGCAHEPSRARPVRPPAVEPMRRVGEAPLDPEVRALSGARASWFEAPDRSQRLYVLELGPRESKRPPLVLIHGVGQAGIRDFYPVIEALSEERRVIAVDLPGFGHSERGEGELGPEHMVQQVASVVWALGADRVDLLGHSSGSALALLMAAQSPERVRRQVLLGVCGVLRPETMLQSQLHEALNDAREKRPVGAKIAEKSGDALVNAMAAMFPSAGALADTRIAEKRPGVELAANLLDYNFGPAIAAVRSPTLLVWGKDDEVAPVRIGHLLDDRVPRSELAFLDGAGHVPMDDQPAALSALVAKFLDGPLDHEREREPADNARSTARCSGEENFKISGDYDEIVIEGCKQAWLDRVNARRIVVRDSDVRFDRVSVREGVVADDARLVVTGGELHGDIALDLHGGHHDLAGVVIEGRSAAVRARAPTEVLFSVTRVKSPRADKFLHEERELDGGAQL